MREGQRVEKINKCRSRFLVAVLYTYRISPHHDFAFRVEGSKIAKTSIHIEPKQPRVNHQFLLSNYLKFYERTENEIRSSSLFFTMSPAKSAWIMNADI